MKKQRLISLLLSFSLIISIIPFVNFTSYAALSVTREWIVAAGGSNITTIGTDNHVLRLSLNFSDSDVAVISSGGEADVNFNFSVAHNTERRILAWTDLCGTKAEVEDYFFVTPARYEDKTVIRIKDRINSGDKSASLSLPAWMLYDTATKKAASYIYVIFTTDSTEYTVAGSGGSTNINTMQRGGTSRSALGVAKEFDLFAPVSFSISAEPCGVCRQLPCKCAAEPCKNCQQLPCACSCGYCGKSSCYGGCITESTFTNICIAPGQTTSTLGFSWFVPYSYSSGSSAAILQIVPASQLSSSGQMPSSPTQFTGSVSSIPSSTLYKSAKVRATGIQNSTEYAYRVGDGTKWSNIYKFRTQNPNSAYTALVYGDPQLSTSNNDWVRALNASVSQNPNAAFILTAGDNTNAYNNPLKISNFIEPPQMKKYPVAAAFGNHDYSYTDDGENARYLLDLFNYPENSKTVDNGKNYFFSYGNTLYIFLNSNESDTNKHKPILDAAVEAYPSAKWRVAVFHHDIYGGGMHATGGTIPGMRSGSWPKLMSDYKIDIVLNGHEHLHTRSHFYKSGTKQDNQMSAIFDQDFSSSHPGAVVNANGTPFITLSTAGNPGFRDYTSSASSWVAFVPYKTGVREYSTLTVDGDSLILKSFAEVGKGDYALSSSVTLRKKATRTDLEMMLSGASAVDDNLFSSSSGISAFRTAITDAKTVLNNPSATNDQIHSAYTNVYDKYFALSKKSFTSHTHSYKRASCAVNFTVYEKCSTCYKLRGTGVSANCACETCGKCVTASCPTTSKCDSSGNHNISTTATTAATTVTTTTTETTATPATTTVVTVETSETPVTTVTTVDNTTVTESSDSDITTTTSLESVTSSEFSDSDVTTTTPLESVTSSEFSDSDVTTTTPLESVTSSEFSNSDITTTTPFESVTTLGSSNSDITTTTPFESVTTLDSSNSDITTTTPFESVTTLDSSNSDITTTTPPESVTTLVSSITTTPPPESASTPITSETENSSDVTTATHTTDVTLTVSETDTTLDTNVTTTVSNTNATVVTTTSAMTTVSLATTTPATTQPYVKYGVISDEGLAGGNPTIFCFVEILLHLVKMPDSKATNNPAAILSAEGRAAGEPTIFCGIEILQYLVGMINGSEWYR